MSPRQCTRPGRRYSAGFPHPPGTWAGHHRRPATSLQTVTLDATQATAPPRPGSLAPAELGFTPQPPVAWLSPGQLARTAVQVVLSAQFGAYLDKRELQSALPARSYSIGAGERELWFDFVADIGDGFNATYSIAYLLGQASLPLAGTDLPRGQVLVLGGDEVYPTASTQ